MTHQHTRIRIGISGWRYPPWRGTFYPKGLIQDRELEFASRQLNSVEINGTFYALQSPISYQRWFEQTPDDFQFSVKCSRYITHTLRLRNVKAPLANFFASGLLLLRHKLGPMLWQLPPSFKFDPSLLEDFFRLLPRDFRAARKIARRHDAWMDERSFFDVTTSLPIRHALEVRNESFRKPEFIELLRQNDIALVVSDAAGKWPLMEDVTSDFVYARLHGAQQMYVTGYDKASLDSWADRVFTWKAGRSVQDGHCVSSVNPARHSRDVFVYFDNDVKVRAPFDAIELLKRTAKFQPARVNTGTRVATKAFK